MQSPEVVDQDVEDAQDEDEQDGAQLGLEANDDHDAGNEAENADGDAPEAPLARRDETDKEEDQQDAARQLEVHLAILLIELRKTGGGEPLAHPRIRQDHEEPSNDRQVAQEEVQVEDQSVAQRLRHDHAQKPTHCVFRVLASDDHDRANRHGDNVKNQE